jgi:hypothetical protein
MRGVRIEIHSNCEPGAYYLVNNYEPPYTIDGTVSQGTLPAASYVVPKNPDSGHPGYSAPPRLEGGRDHPPESANDTAQQLELRRRLETIRVWTPGCQDQPRL